MREAEMADLKKQVDDIAHDIKSYDPLKDVRADVEAAGKDIQSSLEKPAESAAETAPRNPRRTDGQQRRHGDWPGRAGSCRGVGGAGRAAATAPAADYSAKPPPSQPRSLRSCRRQSQTEARHGEPGGT